VIGCLGGDWRRRSRQRLFDHVAVADHVADHVNDDI
jgi:hypothetical protein